MIEIRNLVDCCGCNACVQRCPKQCITMNTDKEGFWYPVVNKSACINCGLCEKVCPQINVGYPSKTLVTYAYKYSDKEVLTKSSSGGAFTLLAEKTINDGGVVFGAAFDKDWNVAHEWVDTIEGLDRLRMSKYVQSDIGDTFKEAESFLKKGRNVLFVGTPCQIHGLKLFLRKDYDNLLCVDFICHGVPSPGVWQKYLKNLTAGEKNTVSFFSKHPISKQGVPIIRDIQFRNKSFGWKKFSFVLHYNLAEPTGDSEKNSVSSPLYTDKVFAETLNKNSYLRGFIRDLYLRPSCYECRNKSFKSGSDITLGDFWGVEDTYPLLYDKKGVSCLMVNTDKGKRFLNCHKGLMEVDYLKVLRYNPSVERPVSQPPFRTLFFKLMLVVPFKYLVLVGLAYNKIFRFFKNK